MDPDLIAALKGLAARYIWWKTPDEAIAAPRRVIARVMDIGDYGDVQRLASLVGDDALSEALTEAEPGWFSPRSWVYSILGLLRHRLCLAVPGEDPPAPWRSFG